LKIFYALFIAGITCSLFALDCDRNYDKNGCDRAAFNLGDDMNIAQYRVIYDGDQDGVVDNHDKCLTTPPRTAVDADGCRTQEEVKEPEVVEPEVVEVVQEIKQVRIVTLKLHFATSKYDILEDSFEEVDTFAQFLIENPEYDAKVVGHTDSRDRLKKNRVLSLNRAGAVVDMLVSLGVERDRLSFDGVAADEPIATNDTAIGRAKNRRIEVTLTKKAK